MIDREKLQDVLAAYKQDFDVFHWGNERYKWEAVKCFQDHWDINAPDLADMLTQSLRETDTLLVADKYYPKKMIVDFAAQEPETVRAMYLSLYDEQKDMWQRIADFKTQADALAEKYCAGKQHYQTESAISIYLWLHDPDRYYIYKFREVRTAAAILHSEYQFKKGNYAGNIRNFMKFGDELCSALKENQELVSFFRSHLTDTCYPDPELHTLTFDIVFYISRYYSERQQENPIADDGSAEPDPALFSEDWYPSVEEYTPGISKEQWLGLLNNKEIIDIDTASGDSVWGGVLAAFYEAGGAATCKQVAGNYHVPTSRIIGNCTQLAKRIHRETQCPLLDQENAKYWPILFQGKRAGPDIAGGYIWKLRPELFEALTEFDIMRYRWEAADDDPAALRAVDSYTKADFLEEVFLSEESYDTLAAVLRNKKNVILQGAPGVGKTFAAKRLAWAMMGQKDGSRIEMVQFHQNYSYEDFIMGYKPAGDGFALKYGIFYRFCQKAANQPDKEHFFIIDEINRGNMSRIFGELLMLIERDYRGTETTLAYNGLPFSVPENLYIIGMMNTADRSLAMIDYALRRRFSFFEMGPGFDSEGFIRYQQHLNDETFNELIAKVKELNRAIAADKSLGRGFCIGHSYFCGQDTCTEQWLRSVVEYDILPMLSEYWFDEPARLAAWENSLRGVFQ